MGTAITGRYRRHAITALYVTALLVVVLSVVYRHQPGFLIVGGCYLFLVYLYLRMVRGLPGRPNDPEVSRQRDGRDDTRFARRQAAGYDENISKVKSDFIATISHEVRTPMNAVMGMSDLLQLTLLTQKQQGYVQTIQSSGNMLLSLVNNALDYSQLQEGTLVIERGEFSVTEFVQRVLEIMGFQAYSKGLELACRVDCNMPSRITGDEDRLRQVLVNLISNGIRFTDHGEVIVDVATKVDTHGQRVWLCSVIDSGAGISQDIMEQMFHPFISCDDETVAGQHASGLGLTICKWLIESMGGNIGVESELGKGTRVWFSLPLQESPAREASADILTENLDGKSALIVHGNSRIATIIGEFLQNWGMAHDAVANADEAMECLRDKVTCGAPYSVAVIDSSLAETDGLALARRIRDNGEIAGLPIVLLTPITQPLEIGQISSIGRIKCLNKPLLPTELGSSLSGLIEGDDDLRTTPVTANIESTVADEPGQNLRILIAEDNPLNSRLMLRMLQSLDYQADTVSDGTAVLQLLEQKPYDLILMDCQMPGMDGDQVTRRIRNSPNEYCCQPIVIAVTADVTAQHQLACRMAGMDDFIAKPVRLDNLDDKISRWRAHLGRRKALLTEAQPVASPEHLLRTHLQGRVGADRDFLSGYIDLFLEDTSRRLEILGDALENDDRVALQRESHALKGACLEMGASTMVAYCDTVRDAAIDDRLGDIADALPALVEEFSRIRPIFEAAKKDSV